MPRTKEKVINCAKKQARSACKIPLSLSRGDILGPIHDASAQMDRVGTLCRFLTRFPETKNVRTRYWHLPGLAFDDVEAPGLHARIRFTATETSLPLTTAPEALSCFMATPVA